MSPAVREFALDDPLLANLVSDSNPRHRNSLTASVAADGTPCSTGSDGLTACQPLPAGGRPGGRAVRRYGAASELARAERRPGILGGVS